MRASQSCQIHKHTHTHMRTHTHTQYSHVHSLQIKRKPEIFHTNKKEKQDMQREKEKTNLYNKCTGGWAHYEFFNVPNTSWSAFVPAKIMSSGWETERERESRESSSSTSKNWQNKMCFTFTSFLKRKKSMWLSWRWQQWQQQLAMADDNVREEKKSQKTG